MVSFFTTQHPYPPPPPPKKKIIWFAVNFYYLSTNVTVKWTTTHVHPFAPHPNNITQQYLVL